MTFLELLYIETIVGNFNIKDSSWDLSFSYYSVRCDLLNNIADSMNLYMSRSTNQVLIRYLDN